MIERGTRSRPRWGVLGLAVVALVLESSVGTPASADPASAGSPAARAATATDDVRLPLPPGWVDVGPGLRDPYAVSRAWDALRAAAGSPGLTGSSIEDCTPGTTSAPFRATQLAAVNAMRTLVGVPALTEDPALTAKAQAAGLLMAANGQVDPDPPATWACHTAEGAAAAGASNLAQGAAGADAQRAYLAESGVGREAVLRRRALLCPSTIATGFGDVGGYNATWTDAADPGPWTVKAEVLAWPNPGLVPITEATELGLLDRHSLQVPPGHQTSGATVSIQVVQGGSGPVGVQARPVADDGCGGAVTWEPVRAPVDGETWLVIINGLVKPGGATYATSYQLEFIDTIAGYPGTPTAVTAVAGDRQATVSWAPAPIEGRSLASYAVQVLQGGELQREVEAAGSATSTTVTGLTNGASYTFKVRAWAVPRPDRYWGGHLSEPSGAVVPTGLPGAPTDVTATAVDERATLRWTAPADTGGLPITGYQITTYQGGTLLRTTDTFRPVTSATVHGLVVGASYTFRVRAKNALGVGAPSVASGVVEPVQGHLPFASWEAFVTRQHQDLTGRAPAVSTRDDWARRLHDGSTTKGDLVESLRRGTDNTTNVDPVARLYRAFLGRTPDAGGLRFWVGRKRAGTWSVTRMADDFAASREFRTTYGTLSNRAFVTRIYTDVLGRTAEPSGVDYWTKKLDTRARTRGSVMVGFSESNEYRTKQADNTDVAVAHTFLQGRAPSSMEAWAWAQRRQAGTTAAVLATELLDSEAYATHIGG